MYWLPEIGIQQYLDIILFTKSSLEHIFKPITAAFKMFKQKEGKNDQSVFPWFQLFKQRKNKYHVFVFYTVNKSSS